MATAGETHGVDSDLVGVFDRDAISFFQEVSGLGTNLAWTATHIRRALISGPGRSAVCCGTARHAVPSEADLALGFAASAWGMPQLIQDGVPRGWSSPTTVATAALSPQATISVAVTAVTCRSTPLGSTTASPATAVPKCSLGAPLAWRCLLFKTNINIMYSLSYITLSTWVAREVEDDWEHR